MAIAERRVRRRRPGAQRPMQPGGPAGGGFGGANMIRPAVMPPGWSQPGMGMATGGGYGPGPGAMVQPGGPVDQFAGGFGGAQQFRPPPQPGMGGGFGGGMGGLLGNIAGAMGGPMAGGMGQPGMPPGMGQPQPAVPGMVGGPPTPPMGQPQFDPGVSAGRLAEAQRLAGLGQMGRAKQQWELGGGDWGGQAHRFLRG